MSLSLKTHFTIARTNLKNRRSRTLLTILGIAVGVASVSVILNFIGGLNSLVSNKLTRTSDDSELMLVRPSSSSDFFTSLTSPLSAQSNLTLSDVSFLRTLGGVTSVAPIAISVHAVSAEREIPSATIVGTTSDLQQIADLPLENGTFLKDNTLKTAVIGRDLSLELFGTHEPISKTFSLLGEKFIATGILSELRDPINFNNVDFDRAILVDITQLRSLDTSIQLQQIDLLVNPAELTAKNSPFVPDELQTSAENTLGFMLKDFKSGDSNFDILSGDNIAYSKSSAFQTFSLLLSAVACISLIVGGIGVMNIMLVSVSERTREVGIRKSLGATNFNIFVQFAFESLILCFIGGLTGIIFSVATTFLVSVFTPVSFYFNPLETLSILGLSLGLGVVFGLYPALKAAHKNPIDSLKYS